MGEQNETTEEVVTTEVEEKKEEVVKLHEASGLKFALKQYTNEEEDKLDEDGVQKDEDPNGKEPEDGGGEPEEKEEEEDLTKLEKDEIIKKFKTVSETLKLKEEEVSKLASADEGKNDFELLKTDFVNNYERLREKYSLPSLSLLKEFSSEADVESQIKEWQNTSLKEMVEKKHGLVSGEFEYDPTEASQVGTPSHSWDELTSEKKDNILGAYRERQKENIAKATEIAEQQQKDIKWLAENVWESEDEVNQKISEMNENVLKISRGELEHDSHPYAVKNIVRGIFHEELVEKAVNEAVDNLKAEFAKFQLYLPTDKEMPTDPTKVTTARTTEATTKIEGSKFSPMLREIEKFL